MAYNRFAKLFKWRDAVLRRRKRDRIDVQKKDTFCTVACKHTDVCKPHGMAEFFTDCIGGTGRLR